MRGCITARLAVLVRSGVVVVKNYTTMKNQKPTHIIFYSEFGQHERSQHAFGKTDLIQCIREMLKDGFTEIKIMKLGGK